MPPAGAGRSGPKFFAPARFSGDANNLTNMRDEMFRAGVAWSRSGWTPEEETAMTAKIRSALRKLPFFAHVGSAVEYSAYGL